MQDNKSYVKMLMQKARAAQAVYAEATQKQLNAAARIAAKIVYDNAEIFAKEAVEETGMGSVEDKITKQRELLKGQWFYTKDKKSTGIIGWEQGKLDVDCILKIAKPIGVIGAVMPSTNPTATLAANCMQALKTGNAIIICPHPRAKNVSLHCTEVIREAIAQVGAPKDLVQCVEEPSVEMSQEVMESVDVVVATGGAGIVKAANSSGNPSYGVGQGNCQVCIDQGMSAEFDKLAATIIPNRTLDNAILCTGEQIFIVPQSDENALTAALERHGVLVVKDKAIIEKIRNTFFIYNEAASDYILNKDYVGKSVQLLGQAIGLDVPKDKKLLLVKLDSYGEKEILCREKLFPVSGYITYKGSWPEAVEIAKANLLLEGAGHSSVIYSKDEGNQRYAGLTLPVCRVIVNNSDLAVGGGPYYDTGTIATSGVGCGFWQKNVLSENLNYSHLLNYTRVIYTVKGKPHPTDEEIWAEEK